MSSVRKRVRVVVPPSSSSTTTTTSDDEEMPSSSVELTSTTSTTATATTTATTNPQQPPQQQKQQQKPQQPQKQKQASTHHHRGRRGRGGEPGEPFVVTFIKVGLTLLALIGAVMCLAVVYMTIQENTNERRYSRIHKSSTFLKQEKLLSKSEGSKDELPLALMRTRQDPNDAYGIAWRYELIPNKTDATTTTTTMTKTKKTTTSIMEEEEAEMSGNPRRRFDLFLTKAHDLRQNFSALYGGQIPARYLLSQNMRILRRPESTLPPTTTTTTTTTTKAPSSQWVKTSTTGINPEKNGSNTATATMKNETTTGSRAFSSTDSEGTENQGPTGRNRTLIAKTVNTETFITNSPWVKLLERVMERQTTHEHQPLRIVFLGQSVTAGYGNFHRQSFPYVLERILKPLLKLLDIKLVVHNVALEHVATFPMVWCLDNFLPREVVEGSQPIDVISWDFGPMTPMDLEIYVRNVVLVLRDRQPSPPLLIFRDSLEARGRHSVLEEYVRLGFLEEETLIYNWEPTVLEPFLDLQEAHQPEGVRRWKLDYGAKPTILQAMSHHERDRGKLYYTRPQHEFLGRLLAMFVLSRAEIVAANRLGLAPNYDAGGGGAMSTTADDAPFGGGGGNNIPQPFYPRASQLKQPWSHLLYFQPKSPLHCRTTFDPADDLRDIILEGTDAAEEEREQEEFLQKGVEKGMLPESLLNPKGASAYHKGWVLELEAAERREKQLTQEYEFMGMKDTQKAYYGVAASGTLKLFVAAPHLASLILCESNAVPRGNAGGAGAGAGAGRTPATGIVVGGGGCLLGEDIKVWVGGRPALSISAIDADVVSYNEKRLCYWVGLPSLKKIRPTMLKGAGLGYEVEIKVTNERIRWNRGPCSIAHILWEEHNVE